MSEADANFASPSVLLTCKLVCPENIQGVFLAAEVDLQRTVMTTRSSVQYIIISCAPIRTADGCTLNAIAEQSTCMLMIYRLKSPEVICSVFSAAGEDLQHLFVAICCLYAITTCARQHTSSQLTFDLQP